MTRSYLIVAKAIIVYPEHDLKNTDKSYLIVFIDSSISLKDGITL